MRYRHRVKYNEFKEHSSGLLVNRRGEVKWSNGFIPSQFSDGKYISVCYNNKKYSVHRLIMETYKPLDDYNFNTTVDHKNDNKHDNRLRNLQWLSRGENSRKGNLGDKNRNRIDMINKVPKCGIPIIGIDKYGDKIEFCSTKEAERTIGKKGITYVLHGTRNTIGGYRWYYKNNNLKDDLC